MFKRILGSLLLVGACLTAGTDVHAAAKTVTFNNDGYSITVPVTWKYVAKLSTKQMFLAASLRHLAPSAAVFLTADTNGGVAAVVVNSATKTAAIKSIENTMALDGNTLVKPATYQTITQGKVTFITESAVTKASGKISSQLIAATSHGGKTFYFLSIWQVGTTAKDKADLAEVGTVFGSISLH